MFKVGDRVKNKLSGQHGTIVYEKVIQVAQVFK